MFNVWKHRKIKSFFSAREAQIDGDIILHIRTYHSFPWTNNITYSNSYMLIDENIFVSNKSYFEKVFATLVEKVYIVYQNINQMKFTL